MRELLGEPSVKQQTVWRYDISPIEKYRYDNTNNIDIEGLEKGYIQAQLFTHWSKEGEIEKIELWYTKDGRIFTYYLYPNGSTAGTIYE